MANLKTYLQALLARFVRKNSTDTQFIGNLDWNRSISLSNSFTKEGVDFVATYTTPESGVCVLVTGEIVDGLFITDENQHVNMTCVNSTKIWPAISCVVSKGRQITFNIRTQTLPTIQAVFVPFTRAS